MATDDVNEDKDDDDIDNDDDDDLLQSKIVTVGSNLEWGSWEFSWFSSW